ncbi:hypothetical protein OnM2_050041 [Erysiphe neolycopersici]|uniref:Uncharacterized protein n=1 Tax=Erysiphe neolycopersici TaxID=212602 RepID=A0A420HSS3_9PEZI|nr:hypothetical protein OnM2_050041 [Erysiphe neolycopersici]
MSESIYWMNEEEKWGLGIDIESASDEDINTYTLSKYHLYERDNILDIDLWDLYQEDFKNFSAAAFGKVKTRSIQQLRLCLDSRGVFISKNDKRTTISQTLFQCLQEENPHQWTLDEINAAANSLSLPIKSPQLLKQLVNNNSAENKSESLENKLKTKNEIKFDYLTSKSPPMRISIDQIPQIIDQDNHPPISRQSSPCCLTKYRKEIAYLSKSYKAEQKYGGTGDNIDHKLTIFYHLCARNGIPEEAHTMALSVMLKGFALDHYFSANLSQLNFPKAIEHLCISFEGPGHNRANLDEWNRIKFTTIINANPGKPVLECLKILTNRLKELQYGLSKPLQTLEFLHDEMITACQGVPACKYAVADPPENLGALLNKLHSSIIAHEKENSEQTAFFTDRRYFNNQSARRNRRSSVSNNPNPRCYVCHKENCRSWNHKEQEKEACKAKFRYMLKGRLNSRPFNDKHFQDRFRQYTMDCEFSDIDNEDVQKEELDEVFDSLAIDI